MTHPDFPRRRFLSSGRAHHCADLAAAAGAGFAMLPFSLRVVLDNLLRGGAAAEDIAAVLAVGRGETTERGIPFRPSRVLLQDLAGIPSLVDLAALRDAVAARGGDPDRVNPVVPADLVVDHSLVVDQAGHPGAMAANVAREYARNGERYAFLRWAEGAFRNFRVAPPGGGILHQVAIEHLARVARIGPGDPPLVFPETLVGTDSHTTMVNALGVLGWGVGGIEAEAALLGLPLVFNLPEVVGVRLTGQLPEGATATDLVLTLAQLLRRAGVVERFVEFTGPALDHALAVADRATLANMAPEYGATCAFFPVDRLTCDYLALTGREAAHVALVEDHARAQGLWREPGAPEPRFSRVVDLDLGAVRPCLAGPRRPHERVPLDEVAAAHRAAAPGAKAAAIPDGAVVIAAITSCTNTSNPDVMIRAGLLARNAVARGLTLPAWVKPSLTPGSRVVARYLEESGLQRDLDALGFHLAGFGCATCSGNSGPLAEGVEAATREEGVATCAVLSGNRNFEGRIHPAARFAWLASPPLVVAYALAGTVARDLTREPLGTGRDGAPVFLRDIWPDSAEVAALARRVLTPAAFAEAYAGLFEPDAAWRALPGAGKARFAWEEGSDYIRRPPFLDLPGFDPAADIRRARPLLLLGDGVTTDHISPVNAIPPGSPAGRHLGARGVRAGDLSAYGQRRANHEVMLRGTFAHPRLENALAGGRRGGVTRHLPSGEVLEVPDAAARYAAEGVPLVVVAGRDYGTGSSRDWAAKGTRLLGIRAVLARGFERIHRSNLVSMGVLPLEFAGEAPALDGTEVLDIEGLGALAPGGGLRLVIRRGGGDAQGCALRARLDNRQELATWRAGGILPEMLDRFTNGDTP
ncbi:aconitate hydratase AcnA [Falsiroseomonas sp. CW058]|uniref:aconitate hydratase AcnA n=1 Tax=Falsiroseomonas sp. CW058 TaxID=3388664 RepID=UPI003D315689